MYDTNDLEDQNRLHNLDMLLPCLSDWHLLVVVSALAAN